MMLFNFRLMWLMVILSISSFQHLASQCTAPISSFPYFENFEGGQGGWIPGGTQSDWAYGTPSKPVINSAASGTKCWITGGLTGSFYKNNQRSWLQSPCFDFTNLSNPQIKFKIFWETERKYDGAGFQYSINEGATWITLGSYADFTSCPQNNWFNTSNITALTADGWSGNIQPTAPCPGGAGSGSGGWKLAQRLMPQLAGLPKVMFRFTFAAGSVCNNYDGFAVDDINILNAPTDLSNYTYSCTNNNTVSFTANAPACGYSFQWLFDDPASGTANTSTAHSPVHTFSAPGIYNVSLTVNNTFPTVTKQIIILDVTTTVTTPVACFGDKTGALMATASPAGSYTFQWSTNPTQTSPTASGVGAGTYIVTVSGNNTCPASDTIEITQPEKLKHELDLSNPQCGFNNGHANVMVSGGTAPYNYQWSPNVTGGDVANNIAPGAYTVVITDAAQCKDTAQFVLINENPLRVNLGRDTLICPGQQLVLKPGNFDFYQWQDNSTAATYTVTETGIYSVTISDTNGCTASDTIKVTVDCSDIHFPSAFTPNGDGRNDFFGAAGNVLAVKDFRLTIYNRWAQIVFSTTDAAKKWDGKINSSFSSTQNFVWIAEYTLREQRMLKKGNITVIR